MNSISLLEITKRNLKSYGQEVVEQRAVPDFRDGLKPVHRFILWSCYNLGLRFGGPFKKSARIVGDCLGKYHPHSDQAAYQAAVGLAGVRSDDGKQWTSRSANIPLIEGYGNWGDNIDGAAAMRYTEARLSEFSTKYLLDPVYLAVSDFVPNFSGDDKVPLVLPAKLPVLLLNGSVSIAFGVAAETPSFEPKGVLELVRRCLSGEEITPKLCAQHLVFSPVFGGECVSDKKEVYAFHKHGMGSIQFMPFAKYDAPTRTITLTSSCPDLSSAKSWATLTEKLSQMKEVKSASDSSDRTGFKFEIVAEKGVDFDAFCDIIDDAIVRKYSYNIGITKRELSGVTFERANTTKIVKEWCEWRVGLEVKVLKYLQQEEQAKLKHLRLMLLAVNNLKVIMASLSKEDSAAYLSKTLKITVEEANTILDMKVRQLKSMEKTKLLEAIKKVEAELKVLQKDMKDPTKRVLQQLVSITI